MLDHKTYKIIVEADICCSTEAHPGTETIQKQVMKNIDNTHYDDGRCYFPVELIVEGIRKHLEHTIQQEIFRWASDLLADNLDWQEKEKIMKEYINTTNLQGVSVYEPDFKIEEIEDEE